MNANTNRVSVIGLGKLGSPMAASFASRGFQVIASDVDPYKVACINRQVAPVSEPHLANYLRDHGHRITATNDTAAAVAATDASFIIVPTPSDPEGGFSLRHALPVCESIGLALRQKKSYHLIALTSTVMPGAMDGPIRATLEQVSGKRCGVDFGLCYSPEFIALGNVIHDLMNPDFILIGESDPLAGERLATIYRAFSTNNAPIERMNFVNAELTKIAINTYVTTKITYANMIADLCDRLPGGDVDIVTSAVGRDSRVGKKYLKGAIGYGGPCFPRDNRALGFLARSLGADARLAESTDAVNQYQVQRLKHRIRAFYEPGMTVGVFGLSYKPDTDVVEEAQGVLLLEALREDGIQTLGYDPMGIPAARSRFETLNGGKPTPRFVENIDEAVEKSDILLIATPWKEFEALNCILARRFDSTKIVIDAWRMLTPSALSDSIEYIALGRGPSPASTAEKAAVC